MTSKAKELPKWFLGETYPNGAMVTNIFSGESIELDNLELSMYDFIIGCAETGAFQKDMAKGLTWFRKVNPKAYMVLLD